MALINCPECGREISDTNHACPFCGYTLKKKKSPLKPILIVLTALIICAAIAAGAWFMVIRPNKLLTQAENLISRGKFSEADIVLAQLPDSDRKNNLLTQIVLHDVEEALDAGNFELAEKTLSSLPEDAADEELRYELNSQQAKALLGQGRYIEADALYAELEQTDEIRQIREQLFYESRALVCAAMVQDKLINPESMKLDEVLMLYGGTSVDEAASTDEKEVMVFDEPDCLLHYTAESRGGMTVDGFVLFTWDGEDKAYNMGTDVDTLEVDNELEMSRKTKYMDLADSLDYLSEQQAIAEINLTLLMSPAVGSVDISRMNEVVKSGCAGNVQMLEHNDIVPQPTPQINEITAEAPAEELPAAEAPAEEVPAEEVPAEELPAAEAPAEEAAAEEDPAEEVPAEEVPAEELPAAEAPAGEVPAEEYPAEEVLTVDVSAEPTPTTAPISTPTPAPTSTPSPTPTPTPKPTSAPTPTPTPSPTPTPTPTPTPSPSPTPTPAPTVEVRDWLFTYDCDSDGNAIITHFDWSSNGGKDIYVPEQIDGHSVTEIGPFAFSDESMLLGYIMGEKVAVILPDTITVIGEKAFYETEIEAVTIPAGVRFIGSGAFAGCFLKQFSVDPANEVYATIDGVLYNKEAKELVAVPMLYVNNDAGFVIPDGITSLGEYAFTKTRLAEISIPASVTDIKAYCFYGAKVNAGKEVFAENVTTIGNNAFEYGQLNLGAKPFPKVETIGNDAFGLTRFSDALVLPETLRSIGSGAFNCTYIEEIDLSSTKVTVIPDNAFYQVRGATAEEKARIRLPTSLTAIGDQAFTASNLLFDSGKLVLPDGLQSIGELAFFFYNNGPDVLTIPASVTAIGNRICDQAATQLEVEPGSRAELYALENGYTIYNKVGDDTSWLQATATDAPAQTNGNSTPNPTTFPEGYAPFGKPEGYASFDGLGGYNNELEAMFQ